MSEKITINNGQLQVPDNPIIPFIEGDGVGKEIWSAAQQIFDKAIEIAYQGTRKVSWQEVLAGEKSYNLNGSWLPETTMEAFKHYIVGIKGPLTTPVGGGIRSLNVALRQELDLYVCLRPVRWFRGVETPIKAPEKVNMTIFRENTEDIYAGIEWQQGSEQAEKFYHFLHTEMGVSKVRFPATSAFGVKPVSVEGSTRLISAALDYAIMHKLPSVTLVHKGNIMKFTEGGFKQWGYELAEQQYGEFVFTMNQYAELKKAQGLDAAEQALKQATQAGKIIVKDVITDAFLQNTLLKPEAYSVIATLNLNGDYVSDQLAAMVGGIGIAPGANINYKTGHAIFEATHGTAPDIAGQNQANPSSLLLSGVMLFDYLGWFEVGKRITSAMEILFQQGQATVDLARFMDKGQMLTTTQFTQAMLDNL